MALDARIFPWSLVEHGNAEATVLSRGMGLVGTTIGIHFPISRTHEEILQPTYEARQSLDTCFHMCALVLCHRVQSWSSYSYTNKTLTEASWEWESEKT